jgi:hypothetical protein
MLSKYIYTAKVNVDVERNEPARYGIMLEVSMRQV